MFNAVTNYNNQRYSAILAELCQVFQDICLLFIFRKVPEPLGGGGVMKKSDLGRAQNNPALLIMTLSLQM